MNLKKYKLWILLAVVALVLYFALNPTREGVEDGGTRAEKETPKCPVGSTPTDLGDCLGPCPQGKIGNGNSCFEPGSDQRPTMRPKIAPLSCLNGGIMMDGLCYKKCPAGKKLEKREPFGYMCVIDKTATQNNTTTQNNSRRPTCSPYYKSITGGSLEQKCFTS